MKQYLIIGNSAAGIAAAEAIRRVDKDSKVIMVSDEGYASYCRCLISYYLAKEVKEDEISYRPENFYKENNIELILNKKVVSVTPKKNRITCEDKSQIAYDYLLIATGGSPKFPEIKGIRKEGVFGFRTLKDAKSIEEMLTIARSVCVLGGGLIGLKAAYALKKRGVKIKVVVKSKQILSQVLDFKAAELVQKKLEENGIEFILGQDVAEVIGNGQIKAVKLDSGKALECPLLIVGKGVEPNINLVKDTEIKVNAGIISNNLMQTNIANIFAAGDVCESLDLTTGAFAINALWPVAVEQGKIAGANMAGENINYEGSLGMNSLEFFGLPTVSLGIHRITDPKVYEEIIAEDKNLNIYKKFIFKNNCLVGAVLVSDIKNSGVFLRLIREKIDVSPFKDKLLQDNFGYPDIINYLKDKESVYV